VLVRGSAELSAALSAGGILHIRMLRGCSPTVITNNKVSEGIEKQTGKNSSLE